MISYKWIAKDSNDKIWIFEKKPKYDEQNNCWWSDKGEEVFDIAQYPLPLKTKKYLINQYRRIVKSEKSLLKLDPETWIIM